MFGCWGGGFGAGKGVRGTQLQYKEKEPIFHFCLFSWFDYSLTTQTWIELVLPGLGNMFQSLGKQLQYKKLNRKTSMHNKSRLEP